MVQILNLRSKKSAAIATPISQFVRRATEHPFNGVRVEHDDEREKRANHPQLNEGTRLHSDEDDVRTYLFDLGVECGESDGISEDEFEHWGRTSRNWMDEQRIAQFDLALRVKLDERLQDAGWPMEADGKHRDAWKVTRC